jgi:hypothetical protein
LVVVDSVGYRSPPVGWVREAWRVDVGSSGWLGGGFRVAELRVAEVFEFFRKPLRTKLEAKKR